MQQLSTARLGQRLFQCIHKSQKSKWGVTRVITPTLRQEHHISSTATNHKYSRWEMPYHKELKARTEEMAEKGTAPQFRRSQFIEWNLEAELYALGQRLNEEFDRVMLLQALTDRSHVMEQVKKQQDLGIVDATKYSTEEEKQSTNEELAHEGRRFVSQVCQPFIRKAWPSLPEEGVRSILDHLGSDEVMSIVGRSFGLRDLIFAEEYPPTDEVMATAANAIIGALARSSGAERASNFVIDFVAVHLAGKSIWDMWQLDDAEAVLASILARSGESAEPRLVHEAGKHTLEATYQVALYYASNKTFLAKGYGESPEEALNQASHDALSRLFGDTLSRAALPFPRSLPPQHSNIPYAPHTDDGSKPAVSLEAFSLDNADSRYSNIVVC